MDTPQSSVYRFGEFELDCAASELRLDGRQTRLQPQPFKLLALLVRRAGRVVTREEIRQELWGEGTFVDFDQAVNFAIKQVREALRDDADRPTYVRTVPRRGYRFIAPVDTGEKRRPAKNADGTTVRLQKALWANIAEMRLAEGRRRRIRRAATGVALLLIALLAILVALGKIRIDV